MKDAKAAHVKAKADAKVVRETASARKDASNKGAEVRKNAATDKREADFKAAGARCDALAGDPCDRCVADAKTRFSMY